MSPYRSKQLDLFPKEEKRLKRILNYEKTLPIVELYTAVQGEGSRQGKPTVVIRTTGCSHRCYFGEGGWCDSWYTSIHPEKGKINFNDIVEIYDRNPQISEMMLTGGSPTMHAALVNELTHFCQERGIFLTIETEGSHFVETDYPIDLLSISPKFSNSIPVVGELTPKGAVVTEKMVKQHNKFRLNKSTIMKMMAYHSDFHIKPVVNPDEMPKVWKEVETFLQEIDCPKEKVYIMPPGDTREELIRVYPMVMEFCIKSGYGFTGRPHIIGYDTQREV